MAFLGSVGLPATRRLAFRGQIVGLHVFCRRLQSLHLIKISAKEGLTAFLVVPKDGFSLLANSGKTGITVIERGKCWCLLTICGGASMAAALKYGHFDNGTSKIMHIYILYIQYVSDHQKHTVHCSHSEIIRYDIVQEVLDLGHGKHCVITVSFL